MAEKTGEGQGWYAKRGLKRLTTDVPESVKTKAAAIAAQRGESLSGFLRRVIEEAVKGGAK